MSTMCQLNSKSNWLNFTKYFVHVACGRGSIRLYGVVLRYALPVFWMTSCFYMQAMAIWRVMCIS